MNLGRIGELNSLISRLYGILKKLKTRKENLEREIQSARGSQERLEAVVATARSRVEALSGLGLKASFLEEILQPVQNTPDCSGIGTTVSNEISNIQEQIGNTNGEISWANQEKSRLEAEEVV